MFDSMNPYKRFEEDIKFFSLGDLLKIEAMAASLNQDEIMQFFMEEFSDLPTGDRDIFRKAYNRGKAVAIKSASDKLFASMGDAKVGAAASLSYLKRYAEGYKLEINDSEAMPGFTYNLNIVSTPDKGNKIQEKKESNNVVELKKV